MDQTGLPTLLALLPKSHKATEGFSTKTISKERRCDLRNSGPKSQDREVSQGCPKIAVLLQLSGTASEPPEKEDDDGGSMPHVGFAREEAESSWAPHVGLPGGVNAVLRGIFLRFMSF